MESIIWQEQVIIRLPRFPIPYFEQGMEVIWRNEVFRAALRIANPSWLQQINWEEDFHSLPLKLQHTLWKYANRMCHRSTPFGAFTGMGMWKWKDTADMQIDPSAYQTRLIKRKVETFAVQPYLNPLTYPFGEGLRFFDQNKNFHQECWRIKEIPTIPNAPNLLKGEVHDHPHLSLLKEMGLIQDTTSKVSFASIAPEEFQGQQGELSHTVYTSEGALAQDDQMALEQGIRILEQLSPPVSFNALEQFKNAFHRRFEYHAIPILEALDPDLGVAYPSHDEQNKALTWSPVHAFLMEQWMKAAGAQPLVIDLNPLQVAQIAPEHKQNDAVPHTAVLFSLLKDQLWLRQMCPIGGIPLNARMIPFDPKVKALVDCFIQKEREEQPSVIHADIIYQGEAAMEKVSIPFGLRSYQLSLNAIHGVYPEILDWQDLVLQMQGDELILFSLKYQQQVIPHLNSAYNSRRDEMPLFRLLVDLQYEGLSLKAPFHLQHFFPDLAYYPRVCAGKVILQPACWMITKDLLKEWKSLKTAAARFHGFEAYAKRVNLPLRFFWKTGDQGLVFNRNNKLDMEIFQSLWNKYPEFILEEYLFEGGSRLLGQDGNTPYAHELMAFCFRHLEKQAPRLRHDHLRMEQEKADTKWLSFYVYLAPEQQDRFLMDELLLVIQQQQAEISLPFIQWHFLRFIDERGAHLRVRFKWRSNEYLSLGWKWLQHWNQLPYVQYVSLHPYTPECARYRFLGRQVTERLFLQSSRSAFHAIKHFNDQQLLAYALCCLWFIYLKCPRIEETLEAQNHESIITQKTDLHEWNDEFRNIKSILLHEYVFWRKKDSFIRSILKLKVSDEETSQGISCFLSLFHMHINRLFQTHQVQRERSCYYLFPKMKAFFKAKGFSTVAGEKG